MPENSLNIQEDTSKLEILGNNASLTYYFFRL